MIDITKESAFSKWKTRILIIAIAVAVIAGLAFAGAWLFGDPTLDDAIDDYESGEYGDAIETLNSLIPRAGYDDLEKVYYYRARSMNRLAETIEKEFSDELAAAAIDKKGTPDYSEAVGEIQETLDEINRDTNGDLALVFSRNRSRIVSRGKFYDEFTSKFRGSALIEDLDFEEVQKTLKTDPEKGAASLLNFYRRYPNTSYLAHIVKYLMEALNTDTFALKENGKVMFDLFVIYGNKFPTSPEITRLYTVSGDNVNLRNSPGTEGAVVGKAMKDETVIQLEKSMDTMQAGDVRDYWYRITTLSGVRGWIFGKYLKRLDITSISPVEIKEAWTLEENFSDWKDSNTPASWGHVDEAARTCLSFYESGSSKIARCAAKKGQAAGLFSRLGTARSFTVEARARSCGGRSTAFAYVMPDGRAFALDFAEEAAEISGMRIPLHSGDWHIYTLKSDNGAFAQLMIDGEVMSARIEPVKLPRFGLRGVYCLNSSGDEDSCAEMGYIKIR